MSEIYKTLKNHKKQIVLILLVILFFIPTKQCNANQLIPNGTFLIYNADTKMYDQVFAK